MSVGEAYQYGGVKDANALVGIQKLQQRAVGNLLRWAREPFQAQASAALAAYLRLVKTTNEIAMYPADAYSRAAEFMPCIIATWHGQGFMAPFALRPSDKCTLLVSKSLDGSILARVVQEFGLGVVRGSRGNSKRMIEKGGLAAGRQLVELLGSGTSVAMTADTWSTPRASGRGIVSLARHSARPIVPMAAVTSRRVVLKTTPDRTCVNLPFGRLAFVFGEPIIVPNTADKATLELKRKEVERGLNSVNAAAIALADRCRPESSAR